MALNPEPRGTIKVSAADYNSAKAVHNRSAPFSVGGSSPSTVGAWWKDTAVQFNKERVFMLSNSRIPGYPGEESLKDSDYRLTELEYDNTYAYLCPDDLKYHLVTDAQFTVLKKLIQDQFETQYLYTGVLPNGATEIINAKGTIQSISFSLPVNRSQFNFATYFNQMMMTAQLSLNNSVVVAGTLQIITCTLVMPPFGNGNDFDICSNIMGTAIQTAVQTVTCTPAMAATHGESTGSVAWLGLNTFNVAGHAAISVNV